MTDELFKQDDQSIQSDPSKNYFEELVGEGKKFKSPEDLARGKFESDSYIRILERRLDDIRNDYLKLDSDYKSRAKLEEIVDQLSNNRQAQSGSEQTQSERGEDTAQKFDPKQVENLVSSEIQKYETQKKQQDNYNFLENKLKERYGDSYKTAFRSQLDKAGISEDLAKNLAVNHPNVLLKAIGFDNEPRENYQNPIIGTQRSEAFTPTTGPKRTWTYYEKMRKEQPELYRQPKIAVQMQEDYRTLGKDFEDGDFAS
jgi:hypothetical protein